MATLRNPPRTWADRRDALIRGLRDTRSELSKVAWPTRQEVINLTLVVIALSTALGVVLGGLDLIVSEAFKWLTNFVQGTGA